MATVAELFDLSQTEHASLFVAGAPPWAALKGLKAYVDGRTAFEQQHTVKGQAFIEENVAIGEGTVVEDGAMILGPSIIGKNCQIRHNAYIRPYSIVGDGCVIGNSSEIKHSLIFNESQVPHFNYVGDSILGFHAHLGAGVKISNLKLTSGTVLLDLVDESGNPIDSGLRKLGAIMGDRSEAGCNAVLNPGTILGKGSVVYPNVNWRGVLPANMIAKNRAEVVVDPRRLTN